jgi:hypothetical protein
MSKKKGKKGKKGGGDDELQVAVEAAEMYRLQVEIMQKKLVDQKQKSDSSKLSENEIKEKLLVLDSEFKKEEKAKFDIISSMTTQYKAMQEKLQAECTELKAKVKQQEEVIAQKELEIITITKEKDLEIMKKEDEIRDLKGKIQDMSSEFARMLRETLDKMQDRIELAQWDNEADPQMMKSLKEAGQ